MQDSDTIYALSSGALPSGVAVVRISGDQARSICEAVAGSVPTPRQTKLMTLRAAEGGEIDQSLVLFFAAPASFTGEDCIEFHLHGGRATVQAMLDCLSKFKNTRHAEAGEFTRRAFENGKLDLVEAEGLSDIISAETEMQRRLAIEQASGHLSSLYEGWSETLTHARAMIEAELDFSDEDDIPGSVSRTIWQSVEKTASELRQHLEGSRMGEIIRDGYRIVIAGPPNAGKSSLMNALARRDIAIVTEIAGTTRDVIEVNLDVNGFAVRLYDTAGLRETLDAVEREGVRRARALFENADLILLLSDIDAGSSEEERLPDGVDCLRIGTKLDRVIRSEDHEHSYDLLISATTGEGIETLINAIGERLSSRFSAASMSLPTRERQVNYLREALRSLEEALAMKDVSPEIPAEALRNAAQALGRITGHVDVEDLLDVIFSAFCVGK
ncbi:tRNA uridine-5-carboxymethylaminomethyl(34) synthesis GTPase MnmE [Martelella mediterranea]|uniref:tRNA modification GTPase MnmE n=1 Tax=Martelella mediterranea TaxID=293089 RepID=A0A4R3P585_9HYPH|nr:tRNA uridine-5-carboxymethylaminomethyl(34) synthesis GTPase MnmE [Martelella mediterranea]TCT44682.1 tRNA modification GTPase trmE [Martelella mediterranea]